MESKADDLLHPAHNVPVANPAQQIRRVDAALYRGISAFTSQISAFTSQIALGTLAANHPYDVEIPTHILP